MEQYGFIFIMIMMIFVAIYIYERMTGNGIFAKIKASSPILDALMLLVKACNGVAPSPYLDIANTVLQAAVDATVQAENLWKLGEIEKSQRASYCELMIASTLKQAGVEITDQVQSIINGAVAIVCMLMPHSGLAEEAKLDALEAGNTNDG